jgi:hypothetical protein
VDIPILVKRTCPCGNNPMLFFDGMKSWDLGIVSNGMNTQIPV